MNRRGFLRSFLAAGVGATVAYSFPSIIVPKNIERSPYAVGMKGTPFLINESGAFGEMFGEPIPYVWADVRLEPAGVIFGRVPIPRVMIAPRTSGAGVAG